MNPRRWPPHRPSPSRAPPPSADPARPQGAGFVNVVVPSDWLLPDGSAELESRYSSPDTEIVDEVAVCGPYEGRAHLTIALSQPGEVDATILDDPGRVVLDIR